MGEASASPHSLGSLVRRQRPITCSGIGDGGAVFEEEVDAERDGAIQDRGGSDMAREGCGFDLPSSSLGTNKVRIVRDTCRKEFNPVVN